MARVNRSLETVSTGYPVFEKNQVLTEAQLNGVAEYADDQIRLTRVRLLGIGLVCGLRVSTAGGRVVVSKGVGLTTDGDLLHLDRDTAFDRFKPYDATYPAYAPLYANGNVRGAMARVFELVREGADDQRARPLGELAAVVDRAVEGMTAVLLMESYVKDDDLCSGTDCDNLGCEAVNTLKLLVLDDEAAIGRLQERVETAGAAFGGLPEIAAARPAVPAALASPAELARIYHAACNAIRRQLALALPEVVRRCGAFLGDAVTQQSAERWNKRIAAHAERFGAGDASVQYFYDFLKDVVATYDALRERHAGDTTVCAPAVDGFPKHLLLGTVGAAAGNEGRRTGFYPSPALGRAAGEAEHARFLVRTLDLLIESFGVSRQSEAGIRVTPSAFEDRPLAERAIPFYYAPEARRPVHLGWSHRHDRIGAGASIYSYHAGSYAAAGSAAADPLGMQIGRFPFFRIEGHVGRSVTSALQFLEREIAARNLPFGVRAVMLGTERTRVVVKPRHRFTDLHRLHYLLRQDVVRRLDEATTFTATFPERVFGPVPPKVVAEAPAEGERLAARNAATRLGADVASSARSARATLAKGYAEYRADRTTWRQDLGATMSSASQFKTELGPVARTDFSTPLDTLISTTHVEWLPWLDQIIQTKDDKADERMLFRTFAERHPQLEHFAGVTRGGTFVLAYDGEGTVVADFMLPYFCCDDDDDDKDEEPALPEPNIRPSRVKDAGLQIIPSRASAFKGFFEERWETVVKPQVDLQTRYFDVFEKTVKVVSDAGINRERVTLPGNFALDDFVKRQTEQIDRLADDIGKIDQQIERGNIPREQLDQLRREKEEKSGRVSQLVLTTTELVSNAPVDVSEGAIGAKALLSSDRALQRIKDTPAGAVTKAGLEGIAGGAKNAPAAGIIRNIVKRGP